MLPDPDAEGTRFLFPLVTDAYKHVHTYIQYNHLTPE